MQRMTKQRRAILAALDGGRPLAPVEILERARAEVPALNLATVYRTVRALLDARELVAVEVTGQPPRYERAGRAHHHHFLCDACDRVYDVEGCPRELAHLVPDGFELTGHELVLRGRCARCA